MKNLAVLLSIMFVGLFAFTAVGEVPTETENVLAMKSSGIETLNYRMRTDLNIIINLTVSTATAIFYSRCYLPFLSQNYE